MIHNDTLQSTNQHGLKVRETITKIHPNKNQVMSFWFRTYHDYPLDPRVYGVISISLHILHILNISSLKKNSSLAISSSCFDRLLPSTRHLSIAEPLFWHPEVTRRNNVEKRTLKEEREKVSSRVCSYVHAFLVEVVWVQSIELKHDRMRYMSQAPCC